MKTKQSTTEVLSSETKPAIAGMRGYLSVADIKFRNTIKYLLFHEDYVTLNINQKITEKAFYIKNSIKI